MEHNDIKNPILKKVKNESMRAIRFLIDQKEDSRSKREIFKSRKKNKKPNSLSISYNISIDNKSFEKFLIPTKKRSNKIAYNILKHKYFKKNRLSKSLVFPKRYNEKSMKSLGGIGYLQIKTENSFSKEIDQFIQPETVEQIHQIKSTRVPDQNKERISKEIFNLIMEDLFRDQKFKKLFNKKIFLPGIKTDIFSIHNYLNQLSEFLIFTHLNDIKSSLNIPYQQDPVLTEQAIVLRK